MSLNVIKKIMNSSVESKDNEEYSNIPIDISDIINICKEYSKLGGNIQNQIDYILEFGIEDGIKNGLVTQQSLIFIKNFLQGISNNPYFGDSVNQSQEVIFLIKEYESSLPKNIILN